MKSIAEITTKYINKITEAVERNTEGLKGLTETIKPILEETALATISALLTEIEEQIFQETKRRTEWTVVRKDEKRSVETIFGTLEYERRNYRNRRTGQTAHLLD